MYHFWKNQTFLWRTHLNFLKFIVNIKIFIMFQLCKCCHPELKTEYSRTIYIPYMYLINFDQSGASNLPKYSRNVLKFEIIRQIENIRIIQTNRIGNKITTFIVYQPKKVTDIRTDRRSIPFVSRNGGGGVIRFIYC